MSAVDHHELHQLRSIAERLETYISTLRSEGLTSYQGREEMARNLERLMEGTL